MNQKIKKAKSILIVNKRFHSLFTKIKDKSGEEKAEVKGKEGQYWLYTQIVKDHFFHPRNLFKSDAELEEYKKEADGHGMVGSPACGDVMEMFIKVDVKTRTIKECKWKTFGCASAIASTSILSEMVKGMKLEEAKKITPQDIVKARRAACAEDTLFSSGRPGFKESD